MNELLTTKINYEVNGKEVTLTGNMVKQFLVSGDPNMVTEQEIVMFLKLCEHQKLNPFLKEAYLVKFGNKAAQIITSKEAFMKRAESHSQYDGFEAGIVVQRGDEVHELNGAIKLKNDILLGGWAKVYRKDRRVPIGVQVSISEFSKGQSTWNAMPNTMIRKTAIVNALREAFPESLNAMYTEDDRNPNEEIKEAEKPKEEVTQTLEEQFNQNNDVQIDDSEILEGELIETEVGDVDDEQTELFDVYNPEVEQG